MGCWRLYVDGEVAGTYFNYIQASLAADNWLSAGYKMDQIQINPEEYEW